MRSFRTALLTVLALLAAAAPAAAGPGSGPTTIVSLGDSFISGEGGRWQGNSLDETPGGSGTDRAGSDAGESRVYLEGTDQNGCHRSDVAEVRGAQLPVAERVNLACSGAVAANVYRSSQGGQTFKGEAPQADRLTAVARAKDVKGVVLSIGGNDLGFASIISACVQAYATTVDTPAADPCRDDQQRLIDQRIPTVRANVAKAIDEVRAAMTTAGYKAKDWRFVLQGYPSPVGRASENRLPETGRARVTGGCPFFDTDLNWARDEVVVQLANALRDVARAKGVQFLDLREALAGKEVCAKGTVLATPLSPPSATTSEWVRFLPPTLGQGQGELQESLHPNAYGQVAFGRCLELVAVVTGPAYGCARSGATPRDMALTTLR